VLAHLLNCFISGGAHLVGDSGPSLGFGGDGALVCCYPR
jgi:hypothetical protein